MLTMKLNPMVRWSVVRNLIGTLLLLGPVLAIAWSYQVVRGITETVNRGGMSNPELIMVFAEIQTVLNSWVIPALIVAVVLAALNLAGCAGCRKDVAL
jgi:hypothetical protein